MDYEDTGDTAELVSPPDSPESPPESSTNSPPPPNSSSSTPPSSPPPSSPPPSSPPPSSPPPSSPPPSSPPPQSPPPKETPTASPPPPTPQSADSGGSPSTEFTPPPPSSGTPSGALSPPSWTPPAALSQTPQSLSGDSQAISPPPSETSGGSLSLVTFGVPLLLIAAAAIAAMWAVCARRARKRRKSRYYVDPRQGSYARNYFGGAQTVNWQSGEHVMNLPPPPRGHPGGGWHGQPAMMSGMSGDMTNHSPGSHNPSLPLSKSITLGFNQSAFTYEELAHATNGFAQTNLLGQGGFGYVHKGVLPNGKEVAVKSLKTGSGQGEREFQAEVEIISRVHHRHLVSLVGYCIAGDQRMLVYEFVPNKTLEYHLHGAECPTMDFASRLRIALGSAKGLAYLHEDCHPKIIHRDIKAANILLDYNFEAMVADFGLAKLSSDNYTHVSTRVMGTFGYLAPEYASSGKLTEKSDVYSFGVMLLELITGRRPVDTTKMEDSLVDWARQLMKDDNVNYDELVDPRLGNDYNQQEMARMIACAAASIRHSARRRPKMSQIVRALEGDASLDDLNDGLKSSGQSSTVTSEFSQSAYQANMENFRKLAFESRTTGEYGLNPSSSSDDS